MIFYFFYLGLMAGIFQICLAMVRVLEPENGLKWSIGAAASIGVYFLLAAAAASRRGDMAAGLLASFFFAYLAFCAFSDYCTREVYRFLQYPAMAAGGMYLLITGPGNGACIGFFGYLALQLFLLRRYYGWADTLAFLVSACFLIRGGTAAESFLTGVLHVGASLLVMLLWQSVKGNMDWHRGRLREPSPFLPVIAVTALAFAI